MTTGERAANSAGAGDGAAGAAGEGGSSAPEQYPSWWEWLADESGKRAELEALGVDVDQLYAALDVIGRTGAQHLDFGRADADAPPGVPDWFAVATFAGAKAVVNGQAGPVEALEELARSLMDGGTCTHCSRLVSFPGETRAAGLPAAERCEWRREGARWDRGCTGEEEKWAKRPRPSAADGALRPLDPSDPLRSGAPQNRAARRAASRRKR